MCNKVTYEEFVAMADINNKGFKVLGKFINMNTPLDIECKRGHVWSPIPRNLVYCHSGCPYCAGKKAWPGETDLWTTRPDIAALLKNTEDGYKYSHGSSKKVDFICPDCGCVSNKAISLVCWYGFVCGKCSDGVSYPNKFARALLTQLCKDSFECEYQPQWAKPYKYDNYVKYDGNSFFLEMDGLMHYQYCEYYSRSLEKQQKADQEKDRLAKEHDIEMIRIDCRKSDCDYIKSNMLNSRLNEIFDLSNVDWQLCDAMAQRNLIKDVCALYNDGMHNLYDIKDALHISIWAVRKYIKIGGNVGWCDYSVEKARRVAWDKLQTPINVVDDNEQIIHSFDGVRESARRMKELYNIPFNSPNIINSCKTHKTYKGFNFRYANY